MHLFASAFLFGLRFAVHAAVDAVFPVGQLEYVVQLLLGGGDAARIPAPDDVGQPFGQAQLPFGDDGVVFDDIDGDAGVDVAEDVKVEVDEAVDFHDVFSAHFRAFDVFEDGNAAFELFKVEVIVNAHAVSGLDMLGHVAILYAVDLH